ncbi:MAG TPA: SpoIIE family protein phosphatase [Solirubrobacteraceae bacterium]|jgi:GAF domain-containing protein/anti-sigma regulatory factor (Ser/Thr protein kinase)
MAQARSTGAGQVLLGAAGEPSLTAAGDQLLSVYRLSDPALSELPLQRLLDELLDRVTDVLGVDTVAFLLLDAEAGELVARAAKGIEEEVKQGVRIPLGRGFAGRIAAERATIFIPDVDHADVLNPILREVGIRSLLGTPLIVEDQVLGVLHVGTLHPRDFDSTDATLLQLAASRAAPAIAHAQLFEALDREHRSAVGLQRSLLPDSLPALPDADVAARYLPARDEVGGDWYDVLELADGKVGVVIGDVAGHGVRAAALMGQLRTGLRAYALEGHPPGRALALLGTLLQTLRGRGMATVAYAVVDLADGSLTIANAGHPPPLVVGADGTTRMVDVRPAPPLGALPFAQFEEGRDRLEDGDTIALYTDGLVEQRGVPLPESFDRLEAAAAATRGRASAEGLCDALLAEMVPGRMAEDDVAVVALRRVPVPQTLHLRLAAEPGILGGMRRTLRRWLHAHGATEEEMQAITLAAGEACANAIEHAYPPGPASFDMEAEMAGGALTLVVRDHGDWRDPRGQHRGRGLELMQAVMDDVEVRRSGGGTEIVMRRRVGR